MVPVPKHDSQSNGRDKQTGVKPGQPAPLTSRTPHPLAASNSEQKIRDSVEFTMNAMNSHNINTRAVIDEVDKARQSGKSEKEALTEALKTSVIAKDITCYEIVRGFVGNIRDAVMGDLRTEGGNGKMMDIAVECAFEKDPYAARIILLLMDLETKEHCAENDLKIHALEEECGLKIGRLKKGQENDRALSASIAAKGSEIERMETEMKENERRIVEERTLEGDLSKYYQYFQTLKPEYKHDSVTAYLFEEITKKLADYCKNDLDRWEAQLSEICRIPAEAQKKELLLHLLGEFGPITTIGPKVIDKCMACAFSEDKVLADFIKKAIEALPQEDVVSKAFEKVPKITDIPTRTELLLELYERGGRAHSLSEMYLNGIVDEMGGAKSTLGSQKEVALLSKIARTTEGEIATSAFRKMLRYADDVQIIDDVKAALRSAKSLKVKFDALNYIAERRGGRETQEFLYAAAIEIGQEPKLSLSMIDRISDIGKKLPAIGGGNHFETARLLCDIALKRSNGVGEAAIRKLGEFEVEPTQILDKASLMESLIEEKMKQNKSDDAKIVARQLTEMGRNLSMPKDPNIGVPAAAIIAAYANDEAVALSMLNCIRKFPRLGLLAPDGIAYLDKVVKKSDFDSVKKEAKSLARELRNPKK